MPGATRIVLTGILAVSDDFNRIRLLLLNERNSVPDNSWKLIQKIIPAQDNFYKVPYVASLDNDILATVVIVIPAHRKKYWLDVAKSLRGQWVSIEATLRPFNINTSTITTRGMSLDLSMIVPL